MSVLLSTRPAPGRPCGEIRRALRDAACTLAAERAHAPVRGASWREIAQRASWEGCTGVAYGKAKAVVRDMIRAGELRPVGNLQAEHSRRPMLALAPAAARMSAPGADLAQCLRGWSSR